MNLLHNKQGIEIPYPAVDLDMGVPGQPPSVEESQAESIVHLDNIDMDIPDDPVVNIHRLCVIDSMHF